MRSCSDFEKAQAERRGMLHVRVRVQNLADKTQKAYRGATSVVAIENVLQEAIREMRALAAGTEE